MMSFEEREKTYGKEASVITETFASKQMRPGDTWKDYPEGFHPDGNGIHRGHRRSGRFGTHPVSYTRIKDGNRKELSATFSK